MKLSYFEVLTMYIIVSFLYISKEEKRGEERRREKKRGEEGRREEES